LAHADQPLLEGNVHISAPHIYGTVLEALELQAGQSFSFLNAGSGTGYLSCIVAEILGPTSSSVGVEIHAEAVEHSMAAMERWKESRGARALPPMQVLHGNVLQIDDGKGECLVGFDRIYVGAALEKRDLSKLAAMLKLGGILVGPGE
jgi:protein-L-isoaspartate O-methyltransferase